MNARKWLRANGYDDVADIIDAIQASWRQTGNRTRRNWWDTLAGSWGGNPCKVAGQEFPVLKVAQIRQGRPVTPNAICRNPNEPVPERKPQARWKNHVPKEQLRFNWE